MSDEMTNPRKPQISFGVGAQTKTELEMIAEYLSVSVTSLAQDPFAEWLKSEDYANLLKRARAELGVKQRIDSLAQKVGEDDPDIKALRKIFDKENRD